MVREKLKIKEPKASEESTVYDSKTTSSNPSIRMDQSTQGTKDLTLELISVENVKKILQNEMLVWVKAMDDVISQMFDAKVAKVVQDKIKQRILEGKRD